jgi:WD40 repeat protein
MFCKDMAYLSYHELLTSHDEFKFPIDRADQLLALWRDDTKLLAYQPGRSAKPAIDIYSLAGKKLRSIPWDNGTIKGLGWSEDETLLVVTADGNVRCYDLQGEFTQFSLGHGADNYSVESCRYVRQLFLYRIYD